MTTIGTTSKKIVSTGDITTAGNITYNSITTKNISVTGGINYDEQVTCSYLTTGSVIGNSVVSNTITSNSSVTTTNLNAVFYGSTTTNNELQQLTGLTSNLNNQITPLIPSKTDPTITGTINGQELALSNLRLNNQSLNVVVVVTNDIQLGFPLPNIIHIMANGKKVYLANTGVSNGTQIIVKNGFGISSSIYGSYVATNTNIRNLSGAAVTNVPINGSQTSIFFYRGGTWFNTV